MTTARSFRLHRPVAAVLALIPPIACAWFAERSGQWDLFERSGSITSAVGLVLASRRYLQHGIAELASLQSAPGRLNAKEDIHATKMGLALSAFGTVIWGWGSYLHWWSFLLLATAFLIALRDRRRDRLHLRGPV